MGNRSSSHYPPAPWIHGSYPGLCSEGKRGLSGQPGAYTESYLPHPSLHKSMVSLNADSGYMTSPGDSDRMRMRGSRMSLNHMELDRTVVVHDAKTLKKLEKIEKKQKKLFKKMGAQLAPRVVPMAYALHPSHYPGPAQMYGRAISYDDLHR
uniref:Pleckstrin homology-like domain family B member 2 n=1 Tax=Heterorhabditis bacteriophora TaxID=37862 RepID=A0A1I7XS56_HETBA